MRKKNSKTGNSFTVKHMKFKNINNRITSNMYVEIQTGLWKYSTSVPCKNYHIGGKNIDLHLINELDK